MNKEELNQKIGVIVSDTTTSGNEKRNKILELIDTNNNDLIEYIENDAEVAIPIDEYFDKNGNHITKKRYGLVFTKYLCKELKDMFLTKKYNL